MNIVLLFTKDKKMFKHGLSGCLLMVCCGSALEVGASSLMLNSEINASTLYDDNVTTSTTGDDGAAVVTVTPKLKLTYQDDQWETTANARVSGTTYSAQLQNQFDSYVDFGTAYKEDRGIYSVAASYNVHENRAEEENILGQSIEQLDTTTFSIKPNYTYLFTERVSLSVAVNLSSVDYGVDTKDSFFSYDTRTASGILDYDLSQKSKLSLTLSAMDYESDNGASEYVVLSSKIGIEHKFSEIISGNFSVGITDREFYDRSNQTFSFFGTTVTGVTETESTSSGGSYAASINAGWVTVGTSRDYVSNSVGGLNKKELANAKFRTQLTPLVGITLSINRVKIEELSPYLSSYSYSATNVTPEIRLNLAHNLSAWIRYTRGERELDSAVRDDTVDRNVYYVGMRYVFPSI